MCTPWCSGSWRHISLWTDVHETGCSHDYDVTLYIIALKKNKIDWSFVLTAHVTPPAREEDSLCGAGVHVRRESGTHAVLAVLAVAGVVHAVL